MRGWEELSAAGSVTGRQPKRWDASLAVGAARAPAPREPLSEDAGRSARLRLRRCVSLPSLRAGFWAAVGRVRERPVPAGFWPRCSAAGSFQSLRLFSVHLSVRPGSRWPRGAGCSREPIGRPRCRGRRVAWGEAGRVASVGPGTAAGRAPTRHCPCPLGLASPRCAPV